jgi:hypothetical protein
MANEKKYDVVKLAFLVDSVSIPGTAINNDLTLSNKKHPGMKMAFDGANLLITLGDKKIIIPGANVRGMELE